MVLIMIHEMISYHIEPMLRKANYSYIAEKKTYISILFFFSDYLNLSYKTHFQIKRLLEIF